MELHDNENPWYVENTLEQEGKRQKIKKAVEVEKTHQAEEVMGPIVGDLNSDKVFLEIIMALENEA